MADSPGHLTLGAVEAVSRHVPMAKLLAWAGVELHGEGTQQVRCPIHADVKPSARLYADANRVYCFVCGRHYNAVDIAMHKLGVGQGEAVAWLVETFGAPSALDEMRATLSTLHTPTAPIGPLVEVIEASLRVARRAVPLSTFVRWCRVLDMVRVAVKEGTVTVEEAKPLLTALYGQVQGACERLV